MVGVIANVFPSVDLHCVCAGVVAAFDFPHSLRAPYLLPRADLVTFVPAAGAVIVADDLRHRLSSLSSRGAA